MKQEPRNLNESRGSSDAQEARELRNQLLAETDYLVVPDYPVSDQKREEIKAYRQLLRDIPAQPGFPRDIEWPVKPVF